MDFGSWFARVLLAVALLSPAAVRADDVSALRVVSPTGEVSILLGTTPLPSRILLRPELNALFADVRLVIVERLPTGDRDELLPTPLFMPVGAESFLDDNRLALLSLRLVCRGLTPDAAALRFNPRVLVPLAQPCPDSTVLSRSARVLAEAARKGIPAAELEDAALVVRQSRAIPDGLWVALLQATLTDAEDRRLRRQMEALNIGDFEAFRAVALSRFPSSDDANAFEKTMVVARNRAWADRLATLLHDGGGLVLLDAEHLAGPQGVISTLTARGFQIEPVLLPAE